MSPASNEDRPGALILGIEYQALGLLRQLARAGVRCALVDEEAWGPARFSRFRGAVHQSPSYASDEFWPWLRELADSAGYRGWVVITTHDEQVWQLARNHADVTECFRYAGPAWDTFRHIYDKREAVAWAESTGLPLARTYIPKTRDDLPPEGHFSGQFIVKPAVKREFSRYSNKKAVLVESMDQLRGLLNEDFAQVPIDHLIYQEVIPGGGDNQWSYAGFFVDGEPIAAFTACRLRQHPPDFGRASTCVLARHDPEVEDLSRKALAALKYTGLAEVEWKRDARDGGLRFLEINARSWGWHSLGARVVGNLPAMVYNYLVDGVAMPVAPEYGAAWTKWITDLPVVAHLMATGRLSPAAYVRSLRGGLVSCDWDWDDAAPFFLQLGLLPYLVWKRGY